MYEEVFMSDKKCVGLIEAIGLAAAINAADVAVKTANVKLIGYEYSGYDGRIVVKVEGNSGAVKAAVAAGSAATFAIKGDPKWHGYQSIHEIHAMAGSVYDTLIHNKNTVGDPLQIASGKRPQGTTRQGKWVSKWDGRGKYITE